MVEEIERVRLQLEKFLPGLHQDMNFSVESPRDSTYNCIAWAMGLNDRWVDPFTEIPRHWWPEGVSKDLNPQSLIKAFMALGFEECNADDIEEGYDKVALYSFGGKWSHAARVISPRIYHSKLGKLWDVYHSAGSVFSDSEYGDIYCFMKRKITNNAK